MNPFKVCPRCNMQSSLDATVCGSCGHIFTTQFQPTQTTAYYAGNQIPGAQTFIPGGNPYQARPHFIQAPSTHSPVVALLLSLLVPCIPGIAHIYNKQYEKAGLVLVLVVGCQFSSCALPAMLNPRAADHIETTAADAPAAILMLILMAIPVLTYICYIIDSFLIAKKLSEGRFVGKWEFF